MKSAAYLATWSIRLFLGGALAAAPIGCSATKTDERETIAEQIGAPSEPHDYVDLNALLKTIGETGGNLGNAAANSGSGGDNRVNGALGPGTNPNSIISDGTELPEPSLAPPGSTAPTTEPVFGKNGFGSTRDTTMQADSATGADSQLNYVEVFNPAVVPFKRMAALDAVLPDLTLGLAQTSRKMRALPVEGEAKPDRELFWGSLLVSSTANELIAIPSVGPGSRILSYELSPKAEATFWLDGADNLFVRIDQTGDFRLVFLTDVATSYFGGKVPQNVRISDVPVDLAPQVPADVARTANEVLFAIGVSRDETMASQLDKLVTWFRNFSPGALTPSAPGVSNIYRDLALSQRGVCRHRSYAFVITAQALGIPARYLSNEAHAWTEVFVPSHGWLRIDLGGAAAALDIMGGADKTMHRPRVADDLPKPPGYRSQYTQLNGQVSGLSPDQIQSAQTPRSGAQSGGSANNSSNSTNGSPPGSSGSPSASQSTSPPQLGSSVQIPAPPQFQSGVRPVEISCNSDKTSAFIGESLSAYGSVTLSGVGTGVANQRVDLFLSPDRSAGRGYFLGTTVTDATGQFTVSIDLPSDVAPGTHTLRAFTPGDSRFGAAISN